MAALPNFEEGKSTYRPPRFNGQYYGWWKTRMHDFIMAADSELWDVICDSPHVLMKKLGETGPMVPKDKKEYSDIDRKTVEKDYRAKKILVCRIGPDEYNIISTCDSAKEIWETLQTAHEGTTQVKQSKIEMLTIENKLVRKILNVLPGSWESKVNVITEAKYLQTLTMDELIGNLKIYEMKRKKDSERREPNKEKNLVLKAENSDSSEEDSDMADLTKMFQKMVRRNDGIPKRRSLSKARNNDLCHNQKSAAENVVKQVLAAWGDSSNELEGEPDAENSSMMAVKTKTTKYDSLFALMAQSNDDEEDENDEVNFRDVQRNLKSYSSKKLRSLGNVLIDAYYSLINDKEILTIELGDAEQSRDDLVETIESVSYKKHTLEEKIAAIEQERDVFLVIITDLEETIEGLNSELRPASIDKGKVVASE
ncbi:uncharacterized protein LOC142175983 [Nicotiana tabacum]|uniref:Uncharacterized protein LOC142175983 n=1 Tax=Nicotiana tabacum TaxID=4097 RepID=A0AC58TPF2_TOBAC